MSFTVGTLSTSTDLVFTPSRIDITWDGVSNGKITILPVCSETATTATYSVKVLHVYPADETRTLYAAGATFLYSATAGEPYRFQPSGTGTYTTASPFVVGSTLNTATGEVALELTPANTNYTATLDLATYRTSQASSYQWSMEQARGTAVQLVAVGKLTRTPPNVFLYGRGYGNLVQNQTASFCIG